MTLREIIDRQKTESFTEPATATDEDALGIVVSRFFGYDGAAICRAFAAALEDANFHSESAAALKMVLP